MTFGLESNQLESTKLNILAVNSAENKCANTENYNESLGFCAWLEQEPFNSVLDTSGSNQFCVSVTLSYTFHWLTNFTVSYCWNRRG